ncbi:hypothetical protein ES708_13381 [subsurface metagenome]
MFTTVKLEFDDAIVIRRALDYWLEHEPLIADFEIEAAEAVKANIIKGSKKHGNTR